MIKVGQKVRFDPFANLNTGGNAYLRGDVIGKVIYVYPEHRYFTAEYKIDNQPFKISFNFNDLTGQHKCVSIVKG